MFPTSKLQTTSIVLYTLLQITSIVLYTLAGLFCRGNKMTEVGITF